MRIRSAATLALPPSRQLALLTLIAATVLAPGCQERNRLEERSTQQDAVGAALRIAVMAPAGAEMLQGLDLLDRVVAVGDFVRWPPDVAALPKIGAYNTPNLELVLSLHVDLMVTVESRAGRQANDRLRKVGIEVLALDTETYEGVLASLEELGRVVGREEEAGALVTGIRERMEAVRTRAAGATARRVLFVVGSKPLYAAGPGSHIDEVIRAAGGENVFADAWSPYQLVSMEAAIERLPEVIIDASDNRPGAMRGRRPGFWGQWDFLPAVRENRVYWIDPLRITIPGPRLPEMAELMGKLIHPELFGAVSPEELGPMTDHVP